MALVHLHYIKDHSLRRKPHSNLPFVMLKKKKSDITTRNLKFSKSCSKKMPLANKLLLAAKSKHLNNNSLLWCKDSNFHSNTGCFKKQNAKGSKIPKLGRQAQSWQTDRKKKNAARNLLCIESMHLAQILISCSKEVLAWFKVKSSFHFLSLSHQIAKYSDKERTQRFDLHR